MQLGMIGLGRMGGNMAARLRQAGIDVVGYDQSAESGRDAASLAELAAALEPPRTVWTMVPSGGPTASVIAALADLLEPGDLVVDGGNSPYLDDQAHASALAARGIGFVDVGVSGGVWGISEGYALMVGGSEEAYARLLPVLEALKPPGEDGLAHAGPVGAGHFTKMVHNGIEYGMMQALGEGYGLMEASPLVPDPDAVVRSWRAGTVIRSWLLDLLARAVEADPSLASLAPRADESGEARWMVAAALELGVPLPATAAALYARQTSKGGDDAAMRAVAALRAQFGGHPVTNQ
ncbi:MAG: decarboxylating 6-phosphogluconate dehydrogenase [Bifidobacteriaceae bacterium]|jgi:6-phosphogluconate dehydrogenase|nr:decarboxylating 6-phosphogluconate dehydrogenase [Bifidobacteriaceae bacterium]